MSTIPPLPEADALSRAVIGDVVHGRWAAVTARFDAVMREKLTTDALAASWAQVAGLVGTFKGHGDPVASRATDEFTVTDTALTFEDRGLIARIAFRDDQTIAGLFFLDPAAVAATGECSSTAESHTGANELASVVIDDLLHSRWTAVRARFDATMSAGLSEDTLAGGWNQNVGPAGTYLCRGETTAVRTGSLTTTNTKLIFETGEFIARITFREDQTIAGLYFLNA